MFEEKYNSTVRNTRVKNCLNALCVTDFVVEGKEMLVALNLTYNSNKKFSGRSPRSLPGDPHNGWFIPKFFCKDAMVYPTSQQSGNTPTQIQTILFRA